MSLTSSISDRLRAASRDPLVIFALLAAALFGGYRFMHPDRQAIEVSPRSRPPCSTITPRSRAIARMLPNSKRSSRGTSTTKSCFRKR
jgi:hypothetical protein